MKNVLEWLEATVEKSLTSLHFRILNAALHLGRCMI